MDFDLESFKLAMDGMKSALGLVKSATDMLPDGQEKEATEQALIEAEGAFDIAKASAAKEFGYHLCKCTFPPQIMLEQPEGYSKCSLCGKEVGHDTTATIETSMAAGLEDDRPQAMLKDDSKLSEHEVKILMLLSEFRSRRDGLVLPDFSGRLDISDTKAEYYLDKLQDSNLIRVSLQVGGPIFYHLDEVGRAYLVENDLVD
jgi:hypothetical protein